MTAVTACEALDLLIAELNQLRADNRRLNLELAAARSQRDSCSSASPLVGVTGRPELWTKAIRFPAAMSPSRVRT